MNNQNKTIYYCKSCFFICYKISNYRKHILTNKHISSINSENNLNNDCEISKKNICECGKKYKHISSLSFHKKKCKINKNNFPNDIILELFKQQMEENKEIKQLLFEQNKQLIQQNANIIKKTNSPTQIINCNNTTNKFNLNLFLNEQCKDALNLGDFICSLQLNIIDLENTGKLGYVEGISKIFVNALKELDINKRPVHCSDLKREVLYVKNEDKWSKENEENKKIKDAIKIITHKNIKQIPKWIEFNPECRNNESSKNDDYLKLISNCMTGNTTEEQSNNISKIITKIAKEILIEK